MDTDSKKTEATAEFNEAIKCFNQGKFEDAKLICARILEEDPENVTALNILGGSLARTGMMTQAIQVAERVCSLSPGNAVFYSNLSYLHSVVGDIQKAILVMAQAIVSDANSTVFQTKFARLIDHLEFYKLTAETEVIKVAMKVCMRNPEIDVQAFSTAWHSLTLLDPAFINFATITQHGDLKAQAERVSFQDLAEPLTDSFLLPGLKYLHATSEVYERILTFFRHLFLSRVDDYDAALFLPFLCALAEHCNLNEYVYGVTKQEQSMVDELVEKLDMSADLDADTMARIALISCYMDLMQLDCADRIAEAGADSHNDAFRLLVENTIVTPTKVREYHDTIFAVSSSKDTVKSVVSSSVAKQYEENPYPRWRHLEVPALTDRQREMGRGKAILVAGCGTGYEPLNMALQYPAARIVGIDLSVASLAYGKQKAVEFGIENIDFIQADILQLEDLGEQFDLISCAGVLHHMENPVEGWSKLLGCLKPDGFMKIALYSETARQSVVASRNWIDEQGFASTPEGIRDFRQAIMKLDAENPLKDIMNWTDFYSMSMCRDLVFHVQEQRVTLPWIKSTLNDLDLCCLSARISNPVFKKEYQTMFPADSGIKNLDSLHKYEQHNPSAFRDMYQFWCCRKDSVTAERPPEWFNPAGM